jgi:hypothetical protein
MRSVTALMNATSSSPPQQTLGSVAEAEAWRTRGRPLR